MLLAQRLPAMGIEVLPLPVFGKLYLASRLGVAGQAGLGHLRTGLKFSLQLLEFGDRPSLSA